jgi:hypothetical protein|nr:MAG TPA: hypothetical protein [Caudoviricetes sp.]
MFTVQVEYGMGAYAPFESCDGFETIEEASSYASQVLSDVSSIIRDGEIADNAIIRIWREDKTNKLINSCVKGCS